MTQEEKAKAYDEALERAKKELKTCGSLDCDAARQIFRFFPELCESEDERVWKVIYKLLLGMRSEIFTSQDEIVTKEKALAYLEKQKEKEGYEAIPVESTLEYKWGFKAGKESEKQKEQKEIPLMNGDADLYFDTWRQEVPVPTFRECFKEGMKYAQRLQKEQKPSIFPPGLGEAHFSPISSESVLSKQKLTECGDDEKIRNEILAYVGSKTDIDLETHNRWCAWLEKQKEPTLAEWSEEDKRTIDDAYCWLCEYAGSLIQKNYGKSSMLYGIANKLKSLRPSWKPSEEQMKALGDTLAFMPDTFKPKCTLMTLQTDLKKL